MAKRPPLGVDLAPKAPAQEPVPTAPQSRKPAVPLMREEVADDIPEATGRAGYKTRTRVEKPHVSLYAAPETLKAIKRLALDNDTTAQALYREGLLLMLQKYGLYLDKGLEDV